MSCPKEFTCALFADGELPEAEAREVALHLEACDACDQRIQALRAESRMLVQCLQDVDLEDTQEVPEFAASSSPSISPLKFALGIIGTALGFRASTAILSLPSEFEGINLREWVLSFGVALNAALYAIQNADTVARDTAQVVVFVSLGALFLFGMGRLFKRGAAVGSVFGILLAIGLVASPGYGIDLRKGAAASIRASETVDDTVIAAGDPKTRQSVEVAGTVKGDLIVFGDVVSISGTVEGNVIVAARRLEISGTVGGSLMGVAQTVAISGRIARNLITVGDAVTVNRTAEIAGNVIAAGREAVIDGKTQRDLLAATAILDVRGDVGRNVSVASGQVDLGGSSHIGGNFVARVG